MAVLVRHSQPNSNSEMLSQLVHRTNAILRVTRLSIPWSPSSFGALQCSHIFRAYSWSSQSPTANWSHLNDVYSRTVDVKSERPNSPDERWAMQSRSRMASLRPPKGPYAGKTILPSPLKPRGFLIYQSRKEYRSESRKRCRRTESATIHLAEEQGCHRTQADCTTRKERL
jgi:hypothetical protein